MAPIQHAMLITALCVHVWSNWFNKSVSHISIYCDQQLWSDRDGGIYKTLHEKYTVSVALKALGVEDFTEEIGKEATYMRKLLQ